MSYREPAFVWEEFAVTGTGSITTTGSLPSGMLGALPFASGGVGADDGSGPIAVGDTFPYSIRGLTSGSTESGIAQCTAISGSTLTFTRAVIQSTNSNSAVNWSGETCAVLVDPLSWKKTSAPLFGVIQSGTQTLVSPRNTAGASANNFTVTANTWYRENVLWRFPQTPQYIGLWAQNGGTAGNCRILIHEPDSSGNAGTLLYDSGVFATPTSFTTTFYPSTALGAGILAPGVYLFSHCFDSAMEINVSQDQEQIGAWTGLSYQNPTQKFTYAGAIGTIPPATQTGWSGANSASTSGYRTAYFGKF